MKNHYKNRAIFRRGLCHLLSFLCKMKDDLPPAYSSSDNLGAQFHNHSSIQQPQASASHQPPETFIALTIAGLFNQFNTGNVVGTVNARQTYEGCAGGSYAFDQEKPEWYVSLDTIEPGWEQGIVECNQTLRTIHVRKGWINLVRLVPIAMFIAATLLIVFRKGSITIAVALFVVSAFMFAGSPFLLRYILNYKNPVAKLQSRVSGMGWTLQGFTTPFSFASGGPSIVVTRDTRI